MAKVGGVSKKYQREYEKAYDAMERRGIEDWNRVIPPLKKAESDYDFVARRQGFTRDSLNAAYDEKAGARKGQARRYRPGGDIYEKNLDLHGVSRRVMKARKKKAK